MFGSDEDDEGDEGDDAVGESDDDERTVTPNIPTAPSVKTFDDNDGFEAASDIDPATLRAFVVAVIYANAALLLVALGPMVWYFEGWSRVGPLLFVGGLVAGIRTYQTYRAWDRSRDDTAEGDAVDETREDDSGNAGGRDGSRIDAAGDEADAANGGDSGVSHADDSVSDDPASAESPPDGPRDPAPPEA